LTLTFEPAALNASSVYPFPPTARRVPKPFGNYRVRWRVFSPSVSFDRLKEAGGVLLCFIVFF
jgi:hypothetical protein